MGVGPAVKIEVQRLGRKVAMVGFCSLFLFLCFLLLFMVVVGSAWVFVWVLGEGVFGEVW